MPLRKTGKRIDLRKIAVEAPVTIHGRFAAVLPAPMYWHIDGGSQTISGGSRVKAVTQGK